MGTLMWPLEIFSPDGERVEVVNAMVDTRALYTQLPASLLHRLNIVPRRHERFRQADGSVFEAPIGVANVRVNGREVPTIVAFGNEDAPLLMGVYTLEGTALVVDPGGQQLVPADILPA